MKKIATGTVALVVLLGSLAFAQRPEVDRGLEIDEALVNAKIDAQLRLTMAKLRARTQLARR